MLRHYRRRRTRARRQVIAVKSNGTTLCVSLFSWRTYWLFLPQVDDTVARTTGTYTATGQAAEALAQLKVVDNPRPNRHHKRDYFGFRQTDDDGNGCDVREDVLARDLADVRYKSLTSCRVASGVLNDPYTGKTIHFKRGIDTSRAVQIDHVVALVMPGNQAHMRGILLDAMNLVTIPIIFSQLMVLRISRKKMLQQTNGYHQTRLTRVLVCCAPNRCENEVSAQRYNIREKNAMLKVLHGCSKLSITCAINEDLSDFSQLNKLSL